MNTPKVSICLTTYNRSSELSSTIESIINQTFSDWELIICDDCSTDSTELIVTSFMKTDSRLRYHRNVENLKMPGNLNVAIGLSCGEYIANVHDGDYYDPTLIEKWYSILDGNKNVGMVFNGYYYIYNDGNSKEIRHNFSVINDGRILFDYLLTNFSSAPWGTVMVPKRVYREMGKFDGCFGFISDVEMWLRIGVKYRIGYIDEPLIRLKQRDILHKYYFPNSGVYQSTIQLIRRYHKYYYFKDPPDFMYRGLMEMIKSCVILVKHCRFIDAFVFFRVFCFNFLMKSKRNGG